jgi:hypothetical protein
LEESEFIFGQDDKNIKKKKKDIPLHKKDI